MPPIYLDHQATTPVVPAAAAAMVRHLSEVVGNPHSSDHAFGWAAAERLERSRTVVASWLGADADDVVFASGATEANNIGLLGGCLEGDGRVVVSAVEHLSVLAPARELARRGLDLVVVPCCRDGIVDAERFASEIDGRTRIAALMLVNNETGAVQPVAEVAHRCRVAGVPLHVDAVQAARWMRIDVHGLGCSSLSVSAHKLGGPMGIGALWVDPERRGAIRPISHGGEQEGGVRPGTVPGFLAAGFAAAVEALPDETAVAEWRTVTGRLLQKLRDGLPGLALNGPEAARHPGTLNVRLPDVEASRLLALLQPSVALSQGSACSSGMPEPSHVLSAMGLSSDDAGRSLRISTAPTTRDDELEEFALSFVEAAARVRAAG